MEKNCFLKHLYSSIYIAHLVSIKGSKTALNISGLDLSDSKEGFSMTLTRASQAWSPFKDIVIKHKGEIMNSARHNKSQGSLGSAASSDTTDGYDELNESTCSSNCSTSTSNLSSKTRIKDSPTTPRGKDNPNSSRLKKSSKGMSQSTECLSGRRKSSTPGLSANESFMRRKSTQFDPSRRLSLVDRQTLLNKARKENQDKSKDMGMF